MLASDLWMAVVHSASLIGPRMRCDVEIDWPHNHHVRARTEGFRTVDTAGLDCTGIERYSASKCADPDHNQECDGDHSADFVWLYVGGERLKISVLFLLFSDVIKRISITGTASGAYFN